MLGTGTAVTAPQAVADSRWLEAQEGEREWWKASDRRHLIRRLSTWYAELLGINATVTEGKTILDIGGGPMPLALLLDLPFDWLTVVDPLCTLYRPHPLPNVARVAIAAEDFNSGKADEVWGYNVLQHVIDPAAVLETAKRHAAGKVRWFDWTDTPIEKHHPHTITADWLISQFPAPEWRLLLSRRGYHTAHKQYYCAVVAERENNVSVD